MKLYHGTSERTAKIALLEGIRPRTLTKQPSNWCTTVVSNPTHVYLTRAYGLYFALNATDGKKEKLGLLEVETDLLDVTLFRPDEDFLEQVTRKQPPGYFTPSGSMKVRTRWFRSRLPYFAHYWMDSIQGMGTCSYKGPIPPAAITRACTLALSPHLLSTVSDPSITLLNYQICGKRYEALTKWAMGDSIQAKEVFGWESEVLGANIYASLEEALTDRQSWEKLK